MSVHPWEKIFLENGWEYHDPIPRFAEVASVFRQNRCKTVLDLGCGSGRHTAALAGGGFATTGMDISAAGLGLTGRKLLQDGTNADLVQADFLFPLPFADGAFDAVFTIQVIHHALLSRVIFAIGEIYRVLATGGTVFVTVPAPHHADIETEEVEPNTFVPKTGREAGLPHHFFSNNALLEAFSSFSRVELSRIADGQVHALYGRKLQ